MTAQPQQLEWLEQWRLIESEEIFLFEDWIHPHTRETFRNKEVLECGCGSGQHTDFMAPYAKSITAVDLNTVSIARQRNARHAHVEFMEADIASMDLGRQFDIVISIGVVHHTNSPEATVANLKRHLKPGGLLILWVYSQEGNGLVQWLVEPARKLFLRRIPRKLLLKLSAANTALLYLPVYTLYLLPLQALPFYEYFGNFRKLTFARNTANVFDKLNAPQTNFISRARAEAFIEGMEDRHISAYKGVSWRVSARRPGE